MQDPPFQPDCCACSGNCSLEANPERHALTSLAAATGNWICRARCIQMVTEFLSNSPLMATLEGQFLGNLRSAIASYHWNNEKVRCLIAPGKNRLTAVFSVYKPKITRSGKGSQEDLLRSA